MPEIYLIGVNHKYQLGLVHPELSWQDKTQKVWLSYDSGSVIATRHGLGAVSRRAVAVPNSESSEKRTALAGVSSILRTLATRAF